jgi:hypothetical protein
MRREIETFALMFPEVSFSLDNHIVTDARDRNPNASRIVKIPKVSHAHACVRHLFLS